MITRLTTYLLERHYGFLQTYYTPEHTAFEIFDDQDQPVIHLTVKGASGTAPRSAVQTSPVLCHLAPEATNLVQHLLQLEVP
jgi:hypothetical protein